MTFKDLHNIIKIMKFKFSTAMHSYIDVGVNHIGNIWLWIPIRTNFYSRHIVFVGQINCTAQ